MVDEEVVAYGVRLPRVVDAPTRFALAALVGSDRFWMTVFLGVPLGSVVAASVHDGLASLAAGVPVVLSLCLLWLSHEFVEPTLAVDRERGTVAKSKPYGNGEYDAFAADDLVGVEILSFEDVALVRFEHPNALPSKPQSTAVDAADVAALAADLDAMGVDVRTRERSLWRLSGEPVHARVLGTPLMLVKTVLAVATAHGVGAFATDAVVVPGVVLVAFWLYGVHWTNQVLSEGE
ncbi:hypothetical protein [Halorubellus litoreus]|uniref:PH domain-containing protein n=1 Tax=Halorubellus litoreus TaxID=755308 RepID=A0ABD5VHY3_9EURY